MSCRKFLLLKHTLTFSELLNAVTLGIKEEVSAHENKQIIMEKKSLCSHHCELNLMQGYENTFFFFFASRVPGIGEVGVSKNWRNKKKITCDDRSSSSCMLTAAAEPIPRPFSLAAAVESTLRY